MLWDGLILVMAVVLATNGWSRGLIASWRGLVAIVLASVVVQHFYVDLAAWITQRLLISPKTAVVIGYVALWFSLEVIIEMILTLVVRSGVSQRPSLADRLGGIFYGLLKAAIIVILPLMAVSVDIKIPEPPKGHAAVGVPEALKNGFCLVPCLDAVAKAMVPLVGNLVVSDNPPSFKPVYAPPKEESRHDYSTNSKVKGNKDLEELLKE